MSKQTNSNKGFGLTGQTNFWEGSGEHTPSVSAKGHFFKQSLSSFFTVFDLYD